MEEYKPGFLFFSFHKNIQHYEKDKMGVARGSFSRLRL